MKDNTATYKLSLLVNDGQSNQIGGKCGWLLPSHGSIAFTRLAYLYHFAAFRHDCQAFFTSGLSALKFSRIRHGPWVPTLLALLGSYAFGRACFGHWDTARLYI
jgi:hypothetical protein